MTTHTPDTTPPGAAAGNDGAGGSGQPTRGTWEAWDRYGPNAKQLSVRGARPGWAVFPARGDGTYYAAIADGLTEDVARLIAQAPAFLAACTADRLDALGYLLRHGPAVVPQTDELVAALLADLRTARAAAIGGGDTDGGGREEVGP